MFGVGLGPNSTSSSTGCQGGGTFLVSLEEHLKFMQLLHDRLQREREFFIDNLLVRIHLIIEMILVDRPCAIF